MSAKRRHSKQVLPSLCLSVSVSVSVSLSLSLHSLPFLPLSLKGIIFIGIWVDFAPRKASSCGIALSYLSLIFTQLIWAQQTSPPAVDAVAGGGGGSRRGPGCVDDVFESVIISPQPLEPGAKGRQAKGNNLPLKPTVCTDTRGYFVPD